MMSLLADAQPMAVRASPPPRTRACANDASYRLSLAA
jgi:hypothetical protein